MAKQVSLTAFAPPPKPKVPKAPKVKPLVPLVKKPTREPRRPARPLKVPSLRYYMSKGFEPKRPRKPKILKNGMRSYIEPWTLENAVAVHDAGTPESQALFTYVCASIYYTADYDRLVRATGWESERRKLKLPSKPRTAKEVAKWLRAVELWARYHAPEYAPFGKERLRGLIEFIQRA